MREVFFKGVGAALPPSEATSIKAKWFSVRSSWELYGRAEDPPSPAGGRAGEGKNAALAVAQSSRRVLTAKPEINVIDSYWFQLIFES